MRAHAALPWLAAHGPRPPSPGRTRRVSSTSDSAPSSQSPSSNSSSSSRRELKVEVASRGRSSACTASGGHKAAAAAGERGTASGAGHAGIENSLPRACNYTRSRGVCGPVQRVTRGGTALHALHPPGAPANGATLFKSVARLAYATHQRGVELKKVPAAKAPGTQGWTGHKGRQAAVSRFLDASPARRREAGAARGGNRLGHVSARCRVAQGRGIGYVYVDGRKRPISKVEEARGAPWYCYCRARSARTLGRRPPPSPPPPGPGGPQTRPSACSTAHRV
jgi:hypothetical protein